MKIIIFAAGVAVGYILGARAGRMGYERLRENARKFANSPAVQNVASSVGDVVGSAANLAGDKISDALGSVEKKLDDAAG
ncbi:hypothetical protein [Humibacter sp.]|jgi:hypothetical protein|uniref:hypothetical protein n=1 Tax=Humibacter sp. TaxID=1940291 RepID=UPI003F7E3BAA